MPSYPKNPNGLQTARRQRTKRILTRRHNRHVINRLELADAITDMKINRREDRLDEWDCLQQMREERLHDLMLADAIATIQREEMAD